MFNIKFDADANGMRLLSDLELLQLGNSTSDRNDSAAVNASLDSGDIFMDMYSKNEDDSRCTNVVVEKYPKRV